ncbi:hypothetical protein BpHYR1_008039, partial [Brachionus plicatilis]
GVTITIIYYILHEKHNKFTTFAFYVNSRLEAIDRLFCPLWLAEPVEDECIPSTEGFCAQDKIAQ